MAAHQLPDVTVVADAGMMSRGEPEGDRGRRAVVHPRRADPARPLRGRPVAPRAPRPGHPGRARLHPALARRARPAAAATRSSTTSTGPTGPAARCAASTSRSPRPRRPSPGKAPVKRNRFVQLSGGTRTVNRDLEAKARALAGLKGYVTNLRACPDGTPVTAGVRDRRLPPALPDREELPDVQERPAGPADLPPQTRLHRSPPDHRVRRPGRQPLDRAPAPAGRSASSSRPPAATAPSRSRPAPTPSPPPTRSPTTSARPSSAVHGRAGAH